MRNSSPPLFRFLFTLAVSALVAVLCTSFLAAFSALFLGCATTGEPPGLPLDEELDEDAMFPPGTTGPVLRTPPPRELEAGVEGLGVRVAPIVQLERHGGAGLWRVEGRTTVDLAAVASWVPDDAYAQAELTGPRSFAITFRDASEQNTMASGLPLFVTLYPRAGARAEAAIWFRPRLERAPGSSRISPYATIQPVWIAEVAGDGSITGALEYRGKAATLAGWNLESDGGASPRLTALGGGKWRLGWSFDELAATLHREPPQLVLQARRDDDVVTRAAALEIRAVRLAVTRGDPRQVWPSACEPPVRACLAALPTLVSDTEACGTYRQVLACGGPAGARE